MILSWINCNISTIKPAVLLLLKLWLAGVFSGLGLGLVLSLLLADYSEYLLTKTLSQALNFVLPVLSVGQSCSEN